VVSSGQRDATDGTGVRPDPEAALRIWLVFYGGGGIRTHAREFGPSRKRLLVNAGLPFDDVVDLDDLRGTGEFDAALGEDRHQALTERLELLL
jgi:hypothetical protein